MTTRLTVAALSETVAAQGEALDTIASQLALPVDAITTERSSHTVVEDAPSDPEGAMVKLTNEQKAAPKARTVSDSFAVTLIRQDEKSRGGKLRFWVASDDEHAGASVYIGDADDLSATELTLTICEADAGQATLVVDKAASGRRRASKGRQSWSGRFAYGTANIGVYLSVPRNVAKDLPDEVGFVLDGL